MDLPRDLRLQSVRPAEALASSRRRSCASRNRNFATSTREKKSSTLRSLDRLLVVLAACTAGAALAAGIASAGSEAPPNGVYTCKWIAATRWLRRRHVFTCDAFHVLRGYVLADLGPIGCESGASPDSMDSTGFWYLYPRELASAPASMPGRRRSTRMIGVGRERRAAGGLHVVHPEVGSGDIEFDRVTDLGHADHNRALRYPRGNLDRLGFQELGLSNAAVVPLPHPAPYGPASRRDGAKVPPCLAGFRRSRRAGRPLSTRGATGFWSRVRTRYAQLKPFGPNLPRKEEPNGIYVRPCARRDAG